MGDDGFILTLIDDPKNDEVRLIYADWLEEQGDPVSEAKAEFLRLTVALATTKGKRGEKKAQRKRLQQLAAELDTDWLAVVSRLPIENCRGKRKELKSRRPHLVRFDFLCERRWEDLRPTSDQSVRFCEACQQKVYYCDTITAAREHAWAGQCIAVDIGVIRRDGDLEPRMYFLGRPSVASLRREEERMQPDPVSAERERRKRKAEAGSNET
jgi:uncharacterized protein (TIGR02996 family)